MFNPKLLAVKSTIFSCVHPLVDPKKLCKSKVVLSASNKKKTIISMAIFPPIHVIRHLVRSSQKIFNSLTHPMHPNENFKENTCVRGSTDI